MDIDLSKQASFVGYHHLFNLGNYENERIEITARVEEGQDPQAVFEACKQWVMDHNPANDPAKKLKYDVMSLNGQIERLRGQKLAVAATYNAMLKQARDLEKILQAHGITTRDISSFTEYDPNATRPKAGDWVLVDGMMKGQIIKDDGSRNPFIVRFEDGHNSDWLFEDQVKPCEPGSFSGPEFSEPDDEDEAEVDTGNDQPAF